MAGVPVGLSVSVSTVVCVGIGVGVATSPGVGVAMGINVGGRINAVATAVGVIVGGVTTGVVVGAGPQATSNKMPKHITAVLLKIWCFIRFPHFLNCCFQTISTAYAPRGLGLFAVIPNANRSAAKAQPAATTGYVLRLISSAGKYRSTISSTFLSQP